MREWRVYASEFPYRPPSEVLGTVHATGRRSAEIIAERKYKSTRIVVEPVPVNEPCDA